MATNARKQILVAGLGKFSKNESLTSDEIVKRVVADQTRAEALGFDCTVLHLNPEDPIGALDMVQGVLKRINWDGFSVGFGIRGNVDHTQLFEAIVNASRELSPHTKLMFAPGPDQVVEAIQRGFPGVQ